MSNLVIVCIALLGVLVFVLGANVTWHRARRGPTGNQMPSAPDDRMFIAQRAHGNATEYVPTLIGLLIVCSTLTTGWWLDTLAVMAVVARYVHAVGMFTSRTLVEHGPLRDAGAAFTYLTGVVLAVTAVVAL